LIVVVIIGNMRTPAESLPNALSPLDSHLSVPASKGRKQRVRSRKSIHNSRIMKLASILRYSAQRRLARANEDTDTARRELGWE